MNAVEEDTVVDIDKKSVAAALNEHEEGSSGNAVDGAALRDAVDGAALRDAVDGAALREVTKQV